MKKALFAGRFDPPTFGHLEIIKRASQLFDQLYVGIGENRAKGKSILSSEEKIAILKKETAQFSSVVVLPIPGLVTEFAKANGIQVLIRGIRSESDLSYEMEMAMANRALTGIETLLVPGEEKRGISSTLIRELASYQAPLSAFIPQEAERLLNNKKEQ